jgi:hypothetical protein
MDIDNNKKLTSGVEKHTSINEQFKLTALIGNRKPSIISVVSPEKPKSSKQYTQKKGTLPNTQIVATDINEEEASPPHKHMKQDDEFWNTYDEEASPPDNRIKNDDDYW